MIDPTQLQSMSAEELRALAVQLMFDVRHKEAVNAKLTHEIAVLRRLQFAAKSEKLPPEQRSLLDEAIDADLIAVEHELAHMSGQPPHTAEPNKPRRAALPATLPRVVLHHEPESMLCQCGCQLKRIGEDVSEKLDYTPGVFTVERHIRGKWACAKCETLIQAPVDAHVIDKGIPTAGLLAHVLVAKYGDHRVSWNTS